MDHVKKQSSKSSRNGKTTLKKSMMFSLPEARNRKSNRTETNLVQSCSGLSLSDSEPDEENGRGRGCLPRFIRSKGLGKKSRSRSTQPTRSTRSTQPCNIIKQDVYIQIPLAVMSGNESISNKNQLFSHEDESPSSPVEGQNVRFNYKLIEGFPSCADIRKRKSYVMSYNTETKNAEWVYEILNKSTLENKCEKQMSFGKNKLDNPDYQQGHLAAAANHRWCLEAYHDTYLMSNMIPQLSALNIQMWKTLEEYCRKQAEPECNVHVYTGPLYPCNNKKGDNVRVLDSENSNSAEKAVPTDLFKVMIVENNGTVENLKCYVMPNKEPEYTKKYNLAKKDIYSSNQNPTNEELLDYFEKSIEEIQKLSGLKFKIDKPQHNMTDNYMDRRIWKRRVM